MNQNESQDGEELFFEKFFKKQCQTFKGINIQLERKFIQKIKFNATQNIFGVQIKSNIQIFKLDQPKPLYQNFKAIDFSFSPDSQEIAVLLASSDYIVIYDFGLMKKNMKFLWKAGSIDYLSQKYLMATNNEKMIAFDKNNIATKLVLCCNLNTYKISQDYQLLGLIENNGLVIIKSINKLQKNDLSFICQQKKETQMRYYEDQRKFILYISDNKQLIATYCINDLCEMRIWSIVNNQSNLIKSIKLLYINIHPVLTSNFELLFHFSTYVDQMFLYSVFKYGKIQNENRGFNHNLTSSPICFTQDNKSLLFLDQNSTLLYLK